MMQRRTSAYGAALCLLGLTGCPDDETPPVDTDMSTSTTGDLDTTTTGSADTTGDASTTGSGLVCPPEPEDPAALSVTEPWPELSGSAERLRQYVMEDDPAYTYALDSMSNGIGYTLYYIQMDSLQWRPEGEITPNIWSHWLTVIVPDMVTTTKAHLIIVGGDVSENLPGQAELPILIQVAQDTGTPAVVLGQIPAQPSTAPDRPEEMKEDELVAYSWRKVMETQDPTWAAYFPMTKAAVRAMDTTQEFLGQRVGQSPDGFIVTGFSKRGATAWLTAAADDRVEAVVPGVFTALELGQLAEKQFSSYGQYADAAAEYADENVLQEIRSPEGYFLRTVVDLISYTDALTMPHYVVQAGGDEFFLADAARTFLHRIPGEATQRVIPNESHSLEENLDQNVSGLTAWFQSVLTDQTRPTITEEVVDGIVTIETDQEPSSVTLWTAFNPDMPDFRFTTIADGWVPIELDPVMPNTYQIELTEPDSGYEAQVVEFSYPGIEGSTHEQLYSSHVYITPEVYPFTLDQALGTPVPLPQWRCDLEGGVADGDPLYQTLADTLPMVVRGQHITDVETLVGVLMADETIDEQAMAQCAAARVNIELDNMDWYSPIPGEGYVWEHIATAEHDDAQRAATRCQTLNNL